jgi:hypothetical protein
MEADHRDIDDDLYSYLSSILRNMRTMCKFEFRSIHTKHHVLRAYSTGIYKDTNTSTDCWHHNLWRRTCFRFQVLSKSGAKNFRRSREFLDLLLL